MPNVKFTDLPAIDAINGSDIIAVDDASASGTTKKATVTQVIDAIPAASGGAPGTMSAADKTKLDAATSSATNSAIVRRDSSGNATFNVLTAAQVTVTGSPSASTDATNKAYVDSLVSGLTIKAAVNAATTANVNLTGGAPNAVDGFSLSTSDRVLVKDQTDASQNGIYTVTTLGSGSNGTWTRSTDADTALELPTGSYVFVNSGTVYASSGWVMNTPGSITLGVTLLVWVLFSQITHVPASTITGTLVGSQVANGALTTAKFAAGITPVEIVSTMPNSGNFRGRTVYLTTVDGSFAADKIYRWASDTTTGTSFWTSVVPAVDITGNLTNAQIADLAAAKLTGQITSTQITDSSISTPKLAAGSVITSKIAANAVTATEISAGAVTTSKLAANSVTANELAANSVIVGKVAAGAISTTELAAQAVTAAKIAFGTITGNQISANTILAGNIAAGTITADRMSVSSLSAIAANLGTVTAGTITSSVSLDVGTSTSRVQISSSGLTIGGGRITLVGDGTNPWVRAYGASSHAAEYVELNGGNSSSGPLLQAVKSGANVLLGPGGMAINGGVLTIGAGTDLTGTGGGQVNLFGGHADALDIVCGEDGTGGTPQGWLVLKVNGRSVKVAFET